MPQDGGCLNFTVAMRELCQDICLRMQEFRHVDMGRVAVAVTSARNGSRGGILARLTPLRFERGELTVRRRGREWTIQRLFHDDREMLYILTFFLPRFCEQSLEEKLTTVLHELYHIDPGFNGDLRRFGGRYHAHGHSCRHYDGQIKALLERYRQLDPPDRLCQFLRWDWRELSRRYRGVSGLRVPVPKLLPCSDADTLARASRQAAPSRVACLLREQ